MILDITTSTGHRITVEPEGETAFAVAVNGSVTDVSSTGLGTVAAAREFAIQRAERIAAGIEVDAKFWVR